uniref:Uncharacterized protein n=1 Tax=Arundo donax TaxID=35708 RepID=A0A0A9A7A6_ARUDO
MGLSPQALNYSWSSSSIYCSTEFRKGNVNKRN